MTESQTAIDPSERELLSFRVGEQDFSMYISAVREIRSWSKATPLPHAQPYVRGVINLRGTVLPIIDLATRLGLPKLADNSRDVIIVVCQADHSVGLLVTAVSDILTLPPSAMQSPPEMATDTTPGFISALTIHENRMIRVLDLDAVLPASDGLAK